MIWTSAAQAQEPNQPQYGPPDPRTPTAWGVVGAYVPTSPTVRPVSYREMLCSFRDWDCDKAYRIMMCESTANPYAEAGNNVGLMQINTIHRDMVGGNLSLLYDPETNIRIAHDLYQSVGWTPWVYCSG